MPMTDYAAETDAKIVACGMAAAQAAKRAGCEYEPLDEVDDDLFQAACDIARRDAAWTDDHAYGYGAGGREIAQLLSEGWESGWSEEA